VCSLMLKDISRKLNDRCSASHCTYQNTIRSVHIQFVVVIVVDLSRDLGVSRTITVKSVPVRTVASVHHISVMYIYENIPQWINFVV